MPTELEQDKNGRFNTLGLNSKDFVRAFNQIAKKNTKKRRDARRTLTPRILSRRKSIEEIVRLGKKSDGTEFTLEELDRMNKMRLRFKKRRGGVTGITWLEIAGRSSSIRIDRASNRSNDRRGISKASLLGIRANIITLRVKASEKSVHQEHRVKIRLEEWDELLADADGTDKGYQKAAKYACAGRVSFDCDCGDHQYRYRYMATLGNYCLAPPKEFAFPKIRNPELTGLACKHVIKSMSMLQSVVWQRALAKQMEIQARKSGYGDDKRSQVVFNKDEQKKLDKNRSGEVDAEKLKARWQEYQNRQQALSRKFKTDKKSIEKEREKLVKARKSAKAAEKRAIDAEKAATKARQAARKEAVALARDRLKLQYQSFADAFRVVGMTQAQAMAAFAKEKKITVSKLEELLK